MRPKSALRECLKPERRANQETENGSPEICYHGGEATSHAYSAYLDLEALTCALFER